MYMILSLKIIPQQNKAAQSIEEQVMHLIYLQKMVIQNSIITKQMAPITISIQIPILI